jgi:hypothetical protein
VLALGRTTRRLDAAPPAKSDEPREASLKPRRRFPLLAEPGRVGHAWAVLMASMSMIGRIR